MTVQQIVSDRLCMQCGTCAGTCPKDAIEMRWSLSEGWLPHVLSERCDDCDACLAVCPARGVDYTPQAWWRGRNDGVPALDFLGPWRGLWFGWAADEATRYAGASGGVATAILAGALEDGLIDAAVVAGVSASNALAIEPLVARSAEQVAACRGSKYNMVAMNELLRLALQEPGRYAFAGLPCHIQGLRLAQRRYRRLRERIVFSLGIFCGWSSQPRATELAARRIGIESNDLADVRYRGPGWPGGLCLTTTSGEASERPYPQYFDRMTTAFTPPRCRLCPDGLAELADLSVGDAWLERFEGSPGVSDLIARTPAGMEMIERLEPDRLTLTQATPGEILLSQRETHQMKRTVCRGRLWTRGLSSRPLPEYPGLRLRAGAADKLAGLGDAADEAAHRIAAAVRYPPGR
jgi:coenzyme F420 hydrogenase subunit beta